MDIHAPEHPIHTWRDFFVHLFTITVGLFIALMLEAGVEWLHHRHIVTEARENIRTELEQNHRAMDGNIRDLGRNLQTMKDNIRTINVLRKGSKSNNLSLAYSMQFSNPSEAAWNTARDTGALAYMPYSEVQSYADLYATQSDTNRQATEIAHHEFTLLAPTEMGLDVENLPPAEYESMLHGSASALIEICAFRQQVEELDQFYLSALGKDPKTVKIDSCSNLMQ